MGIVPTKERPGYLKSHSDNRYVNHIHKRIKEVRRTLFAPMGGKNHYQVPDTWSREFKVLLVGEVLIYSATNWITGDFWVPVLWAIKDKSFVDQLQFILDNILPIEQQRYIFEKFSLVRGQVKFHPAIELMEM